jgi:transcription termination/antitermination protein NusG
MNTNLKWYALKVTANHERKIKEYIEKDIRIRGLEKWVTDLFVPIEKVARTIRGKSVLRDNVIMPGYLFVMADLNHGEVAPCLERVSGVFGFLSMDEGKVTATPVEVRERDMNRFLKMGDSPTIDESSLYVFSEKERVKLLDGAFANFAGVISNVDTTKNKLTVVVTIFGRETPVIVDFTQVEKIFEKEEVGTGKKEA